MTTEATKPILTLEKAKAQGRLAVNITTASNWLGISPSHYMKMAREGKLPMLRLGERYLVSIREIEKILANGNSTKEV